MDFIIEEADSGINLEGTVINFCGSQWFISEVPKEHSLLDGDDGVTDFNSETIFINEDLATHRKRLVVTHELLHVMFDSLGIEDDETLCRVLEHRVYELVRKFPEEYK